MLPELKNAISHRLKSLVKKFRVKAYRDSYVASYNRKFLANQIRALRGELSQAEFGDLLGKPQSVVSRIEDPNYGKWTLSTLQEIASKLDVVYFGRFVTYQKFLELSSDFSEDALRPEGYDERKLETFVENYDRLREKIKVVIFRVDGLSMQSTNSANRQYKKDWSSGHNIAAKSYPPMSMPRILN